MWQTRAMTETTPAAAESELAALAARDTVLFFRQLRQRMREVPEGDLTPAQSSVLLRLDRDGASSTTLLAAAEGIRSQSMTATLNALHARGLIERRPDPGDGRRYIVTLSDAGRAHVSEGRELRHQWLTQALRERLEPEQLAAVRQSLALLGAAISP